MRRFEIDGIPAVLWGEASARVMIAIHGQFSSKTDVPIRMLAEEASARGVQVLSFDLPGHGERQERGELFLLESGAADTAKVFHYARERWAEVSLFAVSVGAYFALVSCADEPMRRALFLSPVTDMRRIVDNMMRAASITPEQLARKRMMQTPSGQTLYAQDDAFVSAHPVLRWSVPTAILCGGRDALCERERTEAFARRYRCDLTVLETGEHWFHTEEELNALRAWLAKQMES